FSLAVLLAFVARPPRYRFLAASLIGICLAWTFAARYGDILLLIPIACAALLSLAPTWKDRLFLGAVTTLSAAPILAWVLWIHYKLFANPWITPYIGHLDPITGRNGQDLTNHSIRYIGYHLFSILVNPFTFDSSIKKLPFFQSIADRSLLSYY